MRRAGAASSDRRRSTSGSGGSAAGIPKSGRSTSASTAFRRRRLTPSLSPPGHGVAPAAPRSMIANPSASSVIHGPTSPSGQCTRTSALVGVAEPEVQPAELPAGVAAADGDLVDVRCGRRRAPRPTRRWRRRWAPAGCSRTASQLPIAAGASASPEPTLRHTRDRLDAVDDDEIEQPVEVEVDERGAAGPVVADDPGRLGALDERAVGLPDQQVAGVTRWRSPPVRRRCPWRRTGRAKPSLLTSANSACHAVDGSDVAAGVRPVGGDAALEGDVLVRRLRRPVGERLQLVVALARQVDLGIAVAGDVLAGDAHAPDLQRPPAVGLGVRAAAPRRARPATAGPSRRGSSAGRCVIRRSRWPDRLQSLNSIDSVQ